MKKAPKGRIIKRSDAASVFYDEAKMKKFYKGKAPTSVSLAEVHDRMGLYNKDGTRRRVQGVAKR